LVVLPLILILLLVFPYQFYIHAAFFWTFGLIRLFDGGGISALLVHLISYIFLYRQGFFSTRALPKLVIGGIVLFLVFASQLRLGYVVFARNINYYVNVLAILVVAALLLLPEIKNLRNAKKDFTLRLASDFFTEKDVEILNKIKDGDKYDSIAIDIEMPVSTLKKHIRSLFERLQVSDRVRFVSLYSNYKIILENTNRQPFAI
jgi:DNA-binding CsgD family transcriptional regulator